MGRRVSGEDVAMKVGFIGLGNIGNPMAANLRRSGFELVVHDLRRKSANNLVAAGATWADDPRQLAAASDVVITSLPGPVEVRTVLEGERGVIGSIRAGGAWIDMSTNSIVEVRRLGAILAAKGVEALDSPVTGGVENARKGKVTMFVGGERGSFERLRPVFEGIGDKIFHMGPLGAGTTTKLITNMIGFIQILALGEGLMLGARGGLDLGTLRQAIVASTAGSFMAENDVPMIFDGSYDPSFSLKLVCKDIRLAVELARTLDVPVELAALVEQTCNRARIQYGEDKGILTIVKLIEDATGVSLRA